MSQTAPPDAGQPSEILPAGVKAPDFSLHSTPDQVVHLSGFKGQAVVLAFYPADWSPVCGDQLALYNEILPQFQSLDAQVLGISVDGSWCHDAFANARNLHFPLLADFHPKGAVGRLYGVYDDEIGEEKRSLFVIDRNGVIVWSFQGQDGVNPGAGGILRALRALPKE